jgi:serine protease AprX
VPLLTSGNWTSAEARFSDNTTDVVSLSLAATAVADEESGAVARFRLDGSPNPFTGRTVFSFELPAPGPARLTIHDLRGRVVAVLCDGQRPAGLHAVVWNGRDGQGIRRPAGVYFYRLQARQGEVVRRIVMTR